jgi:hypothetical protein
VISAQVEYVGFDSRGPAREYWLRVRQTTGSLEEFVVVIQNAAFLSHRVRFQDAPEICFLKLQRELTSSPGGMPGRRLAVTDQDLEEYRLAHLPKAPRHRLPRVPPAAG